MQQISKADIEKYFNEHEPAEVVTGVKRGGYFFVAPHGSTTRYFAHVDNIDIPLRHRCFILPRVKVLFDVPTDGTNKALNVRFPKIPEFPSSNVEVEIIKWNQEEQDGRGCGIGKIVACGCEVYMRGRNILTADEYLHHVKPGCRVIGNLTHNSDHGRAQLIDIEIINQDQEVTNES